MSNLDTSNILLFKTSLGKLIFIEFILNYKNTESPFPAGRRGFPFSVSLLLGEVYENIVESRLAHGVILDPKCGPIVFQELEHKRQRVVVIITGKLQRHLVVVVLLHNCIGESTSESLNHILGLSSSNLWGKVKTGDDWQNSQIPTLASHIYTQ